MPGQNYHMEMFNLVKNYCRFDQVSKTATRVRWTRAVRIVACLAVLDSLLGLSVWIAMGRVGGTLLLLSLLALLAGALAWHGRPGGYLAALVCHGPRLVSYMAFDMSASYQVRGALNLGVVIQLPAAVLVINVFALGMFAASAALLWWRTRGAERVYST